MKEAIDSEREVFLDESELGLRGLVARGELGAICYTLKTLGRVRGYVEAPPGTSLPIDEVAALLHAYQASKAQK